MIERKRRGRLVSARREVAEQNRIRNSYERRLSRQLSILFESIAETTVREYQVGGIPTVRLENVTNRISEVLVPHYRSIILAMADRFQTVKVKQDYEQVVRNYLRDTATNRIIGISTTTQNLLRRTLLEADQEINPRQAAKLIEERVGGAFGRRRAATIARTETHAAASYANHEVAKDLGVPMRKQWVATNDDRSRTWHSSVNGQTVDLDEDFIVPYKGVEYRMKHTGDPNGGAHNTINCRCVTIYLEPEDVVVDDQPRTPQAPPIVEDTPTPTSPPIPVATNVWSSPRRKELTSETMVVLTKEEATKRLNAQMAANALDDRYIVDEGFNKGKPVSTYSGQTLKDFGRVQLGKLNNRALTMVYEIEQELAALTERLNVPRLRAYKQGRKGAKYSANMGDATMGINAEYFNDLADLTDPAFRAKALAAVSKLDEWDTRRQGLRDAAGEAFRKYKQTDDSNDLAEYRKRQQELYDFADSIEEESTLARNYKFHLEEPSKFKIGDDLETRPYTSKMYYSDSLDRMRSTMYHELGHHIHQMFKPLRKGHAGTGRIEQIVFTRTGFGWNKDAQATGYSNANSKEWFAENFSLFWMGKRDLVDSRFIEIMEDVTGESFPR
jgi:hypothetical protein